jgi:hypothetical protein
MIGMMRQSHRGSEYCTKRRTGKSCFHSIGAGLNVSDRRLPVVDLTAKGLEWELDESVTELGAAHQPFAAHLVCDAPEVARVAFQTICTLLGVRFLNTHRREKRETSLSNLWRTLRAQYQCCEVLGILLAPKIIDQGLVATATGTWYQVPVWAGTVPGTTVTASRSILLYRYPIPRLLPRFPSLVVPTRYR